MMPYIWKRLVLPLLLVEVAICLILAFTNKLDFPSLLLNIFSEFIGIIITVALVDQVLTQHEADRWKNVRRKMYWRVEKFVRKSLSLILSVLDLTDKAEVPIVLFTYPVENMDRVRDKERFRIDPELLREPNYQSQENLYMQKLREKLPHGEAVQALESISDEGYRIMEMFGNRLKPELIDALFKTIETIEILTANCPYMLESAKKMTAEKQSSDELIMPVPGDVRLAMIGSLFFHAVNDLVQLHSVLQTEKPTDKRRIKDAL